MWQYDYTEGKGSDGQVWHAQCTSLWLIGRTSRRVTQTANTLILRVITNIIHVDFYLLRSLNGVFWMP